MMGSIAIDATAAIHQGGGIGRYVRELVRALADVDAQTDYRLFVAGARSDDLPAPPGDNFVWRPTSLSDAWLARLWQRARLPIPVETWTGSVGLFHATDFVLPPTRRSTHTLLTVHDLSFVRAPETATPSLRDYLNRVVPRSVQYADRILADSEATRQDIIDLYGTSPDKVHVLLSGVESRFASVTDSAALETVRARYGIGSGPFVLSVGTVQPRKNYIRLVEAMHALNRPDLKLVIAGGKGWLDDPLYERIDALGMREKIILTGFVDDNDLPALYSAARVFALPSLYEGFGLPLLESMACGTPVLTSNVSSLPEVVGEAGLTVVPTDVDAIAGGIARLLDDDDLRNSLIPAAKERASAFTWARAARELYRHYSDMLT